ncbi:MAG: hypothetical protein ACRDRG_11335 [Pseudonocardiaceae bacterium]
MADEDYDIIIATAAASAAGASPLIVVSVVSDAPVVAGIWTGMIYKICRQAGHEIERETASRLAVAVAASAGTYWAGSKVLGIILSKIPFTMAPAIGANAALNALFTLRLGNALIDLMEKSEFDLTDWGYLVEFLGKAMRPRPSVEEIQRVVRLLRRLRDNLAS